MTLKTVLDLNTTPALRKLRSFQQRANRPISPRLDVRVSNQRSINSFLSGLEKNRSALFDLNTADAETKASQIGGRVEAMFDLDTNDAETKTENLSGTVDSTLDLDTNDAETKRSQLGGRIAATLDLDTSQVDGAGGGGGGGGSFFGIPRGLARIAGPVALVAGVTELVQKTSEADALLREVASLQIPGFGLDEATRTMEEFNDSTQQGFTENIPALYQSLSAGVPPSNVLDFLKDSSKLAAAGVADLEPTVGVLSSALNAYGFEALSTTDASNALFGAVQSGVTTLPQLASRLGQVTPLAADLGISFTELNAAVATSTQVSGRTAVTITGLRGLLSELSTSTAKAGKAFQEAAGVGFRQFIEEGGTLGEGLQVLVGRADELGVGFNEMFGSIEGGQIALQLTRQGGEAYASTLANLNQIVSEGTAVNTAYDIEQNGLSASWGRAKAGVESFVLSIGQALIPTITRATDFLNGRAIPAVDGFVDVVLNGLPTAAPSVRTAAEIIQDSIAQAAAVMDGTANAAQIIQQEIDLAAESMTNMGTDVEQGPLPLMTRFALFLREDLIPGVNTAAAIVRDVAVDAFQKLAVFIERDAIPAVAAIAGIIQRELGLSVSGLTSAVGGQDGLTGTLQGFSTIIFDSVLPALTDLAVGISAEVIPLARDLIGWFRDPDNQQGMKNFANLVLDIVAAIRFIPDVIGTAIDGISRFLDIVGGFTGAIGGFLGFDIAEQLQNQPASGGRTFGPSRGGSAGQSFGTNNFGGGVPLAHGAVLRRPTWLPYVDAAGRRAFGGEAGTEIVAPMTDMNRTVDLVRQSGHLDNLVDTLIARGEFDRIAAQVMPPVAVPVMVGAGGPPVVLPVVEHTVNVTAPTGMNPTAYGRAAARQMTRSAERVTAAAIKAGGVRT